MFRPAAHVSAPPSPFRPLPGGIPPVPILFIPIFSTLRLAMPLPLLRWSARPLVLNFNDLTYGDQLPNRLINFPEVRCFPLAELPNRAMCQLAHKLLVA